MLGASIAEVALNKTSLAQVLHFIGDPIVALLIAKVSQKIKYYLQMIALGQLQTYC